MKLKKYMETLTSKEKSELAASLGTSVEYLYQLSTGHRKAGAKYMAAIPIETRGKVTANDLRPDLFAAA